MSHKIPFHRNFRGFIEGPNSGYSQWAYIVDKQYAVAPEHYTRAFGIIQSDLLKMFEYIEPSDINLDSYSYRTHEMLMRTCIEVEANFKAVLRENIYNPKDKNGDLRKEKSWNICDYKKVNNTHRLSSYKVHIPIWSGNSSVFSPFAEWNTMNTLSWYQAYNKSKHDRHNEFKQANFKNMLNAISGLVVLLSSQFRTESFSSGSSSLGISVDSYYQTEPAIGDFFHIEFPTDWPDAEKYEFNWSDLKTQPVKFQKINYDAIQ